jgi:transposase
VPALPSWLIDPIWNQCQVLLPPHADHHPLGCHRPRIPDRVVFDYLVQVLVFGAAYARIADATCSATTLRRRRDEWIAAGLMDQLQVIALDAYDRLLGLDLTDLAVDGCITEAPCGGEESGRSPVDRGKQGRKRSVLVEGHGLPLGAVIAPAARHDSRLLEPTLDLLEPYQPFPEPSTVHLDRGYDYARTPERLAAFGLEGEIAPRGTPAPVAASARWVIERTHAWMNAFKKLVWCTERRTRVIDFWLAFASVVVIVRRLIREGWTHYRWDGRSGRRP